VKFLSSAAMREPDLRRFVGEHGFSIANLSYRYSEESAFLEYEMVICSRDGRDTQRLADSLREAGAVKEFRIFPTGD
jgi:putative Mg2+ transporter-C (MgtC) family protein